MKELLFVCIIFAITYCANGQAECNTPDGGIGICKNIYDCPELLAVATKATRVQTLVERLKAYKCSGGPETELRVCCPDCYTPDGKEGLCKSLIDCNYIIDMARKQSESDMYYIRHSVCNNGNSAAIKVCCGPPPPLSVRTTKTCGGKMSAFPPNPDSNCCGVEATSPVRIVGGSVTGIDEYPWLVLLEYTRGQEIKLSCGGALISGKYVLTAAHCVKYLKKGRKLVSVRVGEYDTDNPGNDCVETADEPDCAVPAFSVPIEEAIVHAEYDRITKRNDIALLRLKEAVNFTDFVRPICLPSTDLDENLFSTMKAPYVAGWGKTEDTSRSRYKQDVAVPFVPMQVCQNNYLEHMTNSPSLWSRQVCAGGEHGKDSCNGDSGGPLMYIRTMQNGQNIAEAVGVVSFGPRDCGTEDVPGVYTKVIEYIPWIRANIKP